MCKATNEQDFLKGKEQAARCVGVGVLFSSFVGAKDPSSLVVWLSSAPFFLVFSAVVWWCVYSAIWDRPKTKWKGEIVVARGAPSPLLLGCISLFSWIC